MSVESFAHLRTPAGRRNLRTLGKYLAFGLAMIVTYTVGFHALMAAEGQSHSWLTGLYWTLTVMSTLGFGDITFHTDAGRMFSLIVLLTGVLYLLVVLPFIFTQFFYEPWIRSRAEARAPRKLPRDASDHVLLTHDDPMAAAIIPRLNAIDRNYVIVASNLEDALALHDREIPVVVGEHDDPATWKHARVDQAALVVATGTDVANTTLAFTIREITDQTPIISTSSKEASVDVLELAGSTHVLHLEEMMGRAFARRMIGGDALAHVIGSFDDVHIAEATAHRTPLVGKTLSEAQLRKSIGITVAGIWERGRFQPSQPDTLIRENTVLVLAGSQDAIFRYDELFCIYNVSNAPSVILGGGNVGCATARALDQLEIDYRIVEQMPGRVPDAARTVVGDAADLAILETAGLPEAPAVVITTSDDDLNVYLTLYCRRLRPDIQILSRCSYERNVSKLHRAGADIVMSYASMGADMVMNLLRKSSILVVAAGLDIFRAPVPSELAGHTLLESKIREHTGCSVVALDRGAGIEVGADPDDKLNPGTDLLLIGSVAAEKSFFERYGGARSADG